MIQGVGEVMEYDIFPYRENIRFLRVLGILLAVILIATAAICWYTCDTITDYLIMGICMAFWATANILYLLYIKRLVKLSKIIYRFSPEGFSILDGTDVLRRIAWEHIYKLEVGNSVYDEGILDFGIVELWPQGLYLYTDSFLPQYLNSAFALSSKKRRYANQNIYMFGERKSKLMSAPGFCIYHSYSDKKLNMLLKSILRTKAPQKDKPAAGSNDSYFA